MNTVQRAYTFRLYGECRRDSTWRTALWQTHEAVNKGAKVFGDWLLTIRGGLDHTLADAEVKSKKAKADREPSSDERKKRRILLALSWLSVESELGAPKDYIVASGKEPAGVRNNKVVEAFEEILKKRGLNQAEIDDWKKDCTASLTAAIRDDAVWVNRSKAFDDAVASVGPSLTRDEAWDMLERFFGSRAAYLAPVKGSDDESSETEDESSRAKQEDKVRDLVQKAGQWLSSRFGTGEGADFGRMAKVYEKIAEWASNAQAGITGSEAINNLAATLSKFTPASQDLQGVLGLISGPGYKSATRTLLNKLAAKATVTQQDFVSLKDKACNDAQKCKQNTGSKGQRPYADAILNDVEAVCGFTYLTDSEGQNLSISARPTYPDDYLWGPARHSEFAVILDHAARRVSAAHTWIKLAEAERSKFEEDAKKIDQIPEAAKNWLDRFCLDRSNISGSLGPYRIRRRAVAGWEKVVAAWSKADCRTSEDRIAAVRALQGDPEIDKFGDIQLFEALAEDNAVCVWHKNGEPTQSPDPQPLLDYVAATEAEFKKRRFKVPAYRHPDALLHPVFCDFGKSRWDIRFDVHKNPRTPVIRGLCLSLLIGNSIKPVRFRWQARRLARDLALGHNTRNRKAFVVPRADRLGRAASNVTKNDAVIIAGLFEQKDWNGRLQAPRRQLEAIARHVEKYGWDDRAKKMRDRIRWFATFSAKLRPQGPWFGYAERRDPSTNPRYWPHADTNNARKGHARLILSRLPGLRVLSVDLGHRYAAACAVWEALSAEQVKAACQAAGHEEPKDSDLYLHLKKKVKKQKKGKEVEVEETTIYRRIGADALPDGKPHPAPWARLDRQFLIKLQGEMEGVREASNEEIWAVHRLEAEVGRAVPLIDRLVASGWGRTDKQQKRLEKLKTLGWKPLPRAESSDKPEENEDVEVYKPSLAVDELMSSAVRTMRLALKRHGDRARIAFAMTADYKPMPGARRYYFHEAKDASSNDDESTRRAKHIEYIQDALLLWHNLFSSRGWKDDAAKQLWDLKIATLTGYQTPEAIAEDITGIKRLNKRRDNSALIKDKLRKVAEVLAADDRLRKELAEIWTARWRLDDGAPADIDNRTGRKKDPTGWYSRLTQLRNWLVPSAKCDSLASRRVGGLSLTRLATLTEFRRKVQVGFFTRLKPDGTRAENKEKLGQSTLDALEQLREQRVKQLASRIVEAALGVGSEDPQHWDNGKRPSGRIADPRFAPCHAIVIEDLTHYRPEETRTRRENRQIMAWSASKVKKYLAEACELYGLHLREVSAGYTSRQDSRTGAPGSRCQDVPVKEFMRSPFWMQQVKQAEAKQAENKGDAREQFLCELNARWKDKAVADWDKAGVVRVPLQGGEIFVSADPASPAAKGIQADLNAAANIGLRALTDPDWHGKWWYVPCDPKNFRPHPAKVKGSAAFDLNTPLKDAPDARGNATKKKTKEVVNLWRDISSSANSGDWQVYEAYQNNVMKRVIGILRQQSLEQQQNSSEEDEIPF